MDIIKFLKRNAKKEMFIGLMVLFFILWSFIIYKISPSKIVEFAGINNSYLLVLFLGFLGGTSILFPFPYYLFVITFGAGGANPILLGIFAGLGVIIGESTSYWLGYYGRIILTDSYQKKFNKLCKWCSTTKNSILLSLVLFIYGAFVPIPNDVLILPLGAAHYNYWKLIIPLGLGNIVFNIILAFGGLYGWSLFF